MHRQTIKYSNKINHLKETGNYRSLPRLIQENMLDLSSNDYLGIMQNEQLLQEFQKSIAVHSNTFSASSSRLLSGNSEEFCKLEGLIASMYRREACLVYNSGYHVNTGILPALTGKNDLILADKLVHASIIDGMQLSKADFLRFNHLDYEQLELLLEKKASRYENIFIVSESIFSMDGDQADLLKLVELKNKYGAFLYLDEAHAVGAVGNTGLGCAEELDLIPEIDFIVGTFGKALASIGAFVICNKLFKNYLINHSRTLIFTTALPPINLNWTHFIMERLPAMNKKREQLKRISREFSSLISSDSKSHIVPFIIGENKDAIYASEQLSKIGYNVRPIRYPTVPKGTARLRFSLNSDMNIDQLSPLKNALVYAEKMDQ